MLDLTIDVLTDPIEKHRFAHFQGTQIQEGSFIEA